MWKFSVLFSYVGGTFCGWQKQKASAEQLDKPSIQFVMEQTLARITGERVSIVGSGRTDAGVHALGQVGHFILKEKAWDPKILERGLNSLLPTSIRVLSIQPVHLDFHAQRSAEKKQYSYYFQ